MAAYRRVDDLRLPAGWLPVHRDQLRAQRSVSSMGSLYLYLLPITPAPKQLYIVCGQYELWLLQKLKLLQKSGAGAQPTIDGRADSETALTRLAPEGASSNSVSRRLHCVAWCHFYFTRCLCCWFLCLGSPVSSLFWRGRTPFLVPTTC